MDGGRAGIALLAAARRFGGLRAFDGRRRDELKARRDDPGGAGQHGADGEMGHHAQRAFDVIQFGPLTARRSAGQVVKRPRRAQVVPLQSAMTGQEMKGGARGSAATQAYGVRGASRKRSGTSKLSNGVNTLVTGTGGRPIMWACSEQ